MISITLADPEWVTLLGAHGTDWLSAARHPIIIITVCHTY